MQRQKCRNSMLTTLTSQNLSELYNVDVTEDHLIYMKTLSALFSLISYGGNIAVPYNKTTTGATTTMLPPIRNTISHMCMVQMLGWENNSITSYSLTISCPSSLSDEASNPISSTRRCSENSMYSWRQQDWWALRT